MHNGKRNNKNNYYYTIETTKQLLQQQTTRVKAPITTKEKKNKKPHCERPIVASDSLLPSNRVQQSVLFSFESSYNPKS